VLAADAVINVGAQEGEDRFECFVVDGDRIVGAL
jgi:hypothetical protein